MNASTVTFEGTLLRLGSYEPVPEGARLRNLVIPNSHQIDLNNGYGLGRYTVKLHKRGYIFFRVSSSVAQGQSEWLLTTKLLVQIQPGENFKLNWK